MEEKIYFHVLQTTSLKKILRRGRAGTAKCTKNHAEHAKFVSLFKTFALLLFDVVLVAILVVVAKDTECVLYVSETFMNPLV